MNCELIISDGVRFSPMWQSFIHHVHGKAALEDWGAWYIDNPVTLNAIDGLIFKRTVGGKQETYVHFNSAESLTWFMLRWS